MIQKLAAAASLLLLLLLDTRALAALPLKITAAEVSRDETGIVFVDGYLLPGVEEKFRTVVEASGPALRVVVRSAGGATETALAIAEIIESRHLSVEVKDFCLSSCANYIFTAGERRAVPKGAILGFHGGHTDNPWESCKEGRCSSAEHFVELLNREQKLFLRRGVSLDVIVVSGWLVRGLPTEGPTGHAAGARYAWWTPSAKDIAELGYKNTDYWAPANYKEAYELLDRLKFKDVHPWIGDRPRFTR